MNRRFLFLILALAIFASLAFSQTETTEPQVSDSTFSDSTFVSLDLSADSLAGSGGKTTTRWLLPMSLISATGAAFLGLFLIRSR